MRPLARKSRGFTLIEVLIASAVATTLIVLLYSTLVWYSRSFQREDENLEKSKRAQEVLGLFRDDFGRAAGELRIEDVPLDVLKETGWDGTAADFMTTQRPGRHQINGWSGYGATSPYISKTFEFFEKWETKVDQGKTVLTFNKSVSAYDRDSPPESLRRIEPRSPVPCVVHVGLPADKPTSEWILIRREAAGNATVALWVMHRVARGKWPAGTLARHTAATGLTRVGGAAPADFSFRLAHDWMAVDAAPPTRPTADIRLLATLGRVELKYAPTFEATAVLLMGP